MANFYLETAHPIAEDSPDHRYPAGTMTDNYANPRFDNLLLELYKKDKPAVLDFGCAGGGMVHSLIKCGCTAVGLEGSDYSQKRLRAEWAWIPHSLFTCDLSYPFTLHTGDGEPYQFDVVTAWEFFEHIIPERLPVVLWNIDRHLTPGGLVFCSINDTSSNGYGVEHHLIRKPGGWWLAQFSEYGLERKPRLEELVDKRRAWVRKHKYAFVLKKAIQ